MGFVPTGKVQPYHGAHPIRTFGARCVIGFSLETNATEAYSIMPSHEAHCEFAYMPEQLFDLAADVECYPEFLPWWIAARVRKREGNVYYTDQVVGFGVVRQRFDSKTVLRRPVRIDVTSTDRMFRSFHLTWLFYPLPGNACQVTLAVDLELRSKLIQDLFGRAILRTVGPVMSGFEVRAHRLYGPSANSSSAARGGRSDGPMA